MNLSAFSSSINYAPPKFYDNARDDCHNPSHQHNGINKQMMDKNKQQKIINNRIQQTQIINNTNIRPKPFMNSTNGQLSTMNKMNCGMNKMMIKNPNQRFIQNNVYQNNKLNGNRMNDSSINVQMMNRSNTLINRNLSNGHESNTLANRLSTNQLGNTFGCTTPLTNQANTLANRLSNDSNSFRSSLHSSSWSNSSTSSTNHLTSLNSNFNNMNSFYQSNASNNLNMTKNLETETPNSSMINSLNASYNFGIWTNQNCNLDVSANWSKFKEYQEYQSVSPFTSQLSNDANNNINQEDNCSIKSETDSNGFETRFNCFNPINSLNLHENFRGLSVDKSLSKYQFYSPSNPVPQQLW